MTEKNVDAVSAPVPASSSSLTVAAASAPPTAIPTSTIVEKGSHKSRDTYEAVLIFDETDDLSDGEGGRSKRHQVVESDDSEDEELENNSSINNNTDNNNKNATEKRNRLLGEDVDVVKAEVTPQQDDHASLSPADQGK